jgi:hypothetical protein
MGNREGDNRISTVRQFETGATRSADSDRDDPEGYLSPLVIDRFNEYMTKHRVQADGSLRDSDNWQKGMPLASFMKGMWRHFLHLWTRHRGYPVRDPKAAIDIEEDLCAILFNTQGYLHQLLKEKLNKRDREDVPYQGPIIKFTKEAYEQWCKFGPEPEKCCPERGPVVQGHS